MKNKFINLYMDWAKRCAELSHAKRLHVGAVIVKDDTVISYGTIPNGFTSDGDCFTTGDYRVQIRVVATGVIITQFEFPLAVEYNEDITF